MQIALPVKRVERIYAANLHYTEGMEEKKRPLQVRCSDAEYAAFTNAARNSGISLSSWARERLRVAALHDLRSVDQPVPFLED